MQTQTRILIVLEDGKFKGASAEDGNLGPVPLDTAALKAALKGIQTSFLEDQTNLGQQLADYKTQVEAGATALLAAIDNPEIDSDATVEIARSIATQVAASPLERRKAELLAAIAAQQAELDSLTRK